jgi:hypothetical protein
MNRAGIVCIAACAAALVWWSETEVASQAAAPYVLQVAELADVALRTFHNGLFRSPADHIVEDRGVRLGSLGSDIFHAPGDSFNEFWAITDRGPNANPGRRTFVAPKFNPVILRFRVHDSGITLLNALPIVDTADRPVTGLPNVPTFDETPYDFSGTAVIEGNPNGLDTEGIVRTSEGHFWLVDEYSPSLVHVGPNGQVIDRFVPVDSRLAATAATTPTYRVKKQLPKILNFRRQNRGFEGLALTPDEKTLFIAMQSPLEYPTQALGRASRNVRILRFDIESERVTGEFVYHLDEVCAFLHRAAGCGVAPGEMKVSGLAAITSTVLLVDERTDLVAKIYRADVSDATNILDHSVWDAVAASPSATTPAVETLSNPASQGITVAAKRLVVDLSTLPGMPDKIEGVAVLRDGHVLAVANDNDFGLTDNATFDASGKLSNDTKVRSKLLYIQLAERVR